jgi:hypothetical protein
MLKHIKRLLGIGQKPVEAPAPYKIEAPAKVVASEPALPFPAPKPTNKPAKKPGAKKAAADKPKAPRKPKTPKA